MSVYKKLQTARLMLQSMQLKKSGKNKFAGYEYFELGDFLPAIQDICGQVGVCGAINFTPELATLTIYDIEKAGDKVEFSCPMSSAQLKGCHDVQNMGAVITYLRRYLWTNAFEIVEHDALDAVMGKDEPAKKPEPKIEPVAPKEKPKTIAGQKGEWQIVAPAVPEGDVSNWLQLIKTSAHTLLDLCADEEDVMAIFKKNKVLFDTVKAEDAIFFKEMMAKFTEVKNSFKE